MSSNLNTIIKMKDKEEDDDNEVINDGENQLLSKEQGDEKELARLAELQLQENILVNKSSEMMKNEATSTSKSQLIVEGNLNGNSDDIEEFEGTVSLLLQGIY